jgi:acyl-CoA reductase-like NAD-dependent aldehyde dehydrogenase
VWHPRPQTAIGIFRFMAVATGNEYGLFINGESSEAASGEHRALVEPATVETMGRSAMAGRADIDRAVEAARAAVDGPWGRTPPTERSRLLHALADAIHANRKELAELESRNVGKAISSVKAEVGGAVENFRFFASVIGSIGGRSNPVGGSLLTYSLKEPVGVAAQTRSTRSICTSRRRAYLSRPAPSRSTRSGFSG